MARAPAVRTDHRVPRSLSAADIRGTIGTFYYFATDLSRYEEGNTEMGGILKRLRFEGDVARSEIIGPQNPMVNWRPDAPVTPISSPDSLSQDLYGQLGIFRTLGWAEATWPLNEDRNDEQTFLDDLFHAFDDRARIILHEIDSKKFDLVIGVIESTGRVSHMFWRFIDPTHPMNDPVLAAKYGDSIERVYRRCDQLVGEVLERIDPGTLVFVLSDHGFHSFKYGVNLNTWLVDNGYIAPTVLKYFGVDIPEAIDGKPLL